MFAPQHAFTGQSCICSAELTAADSITQLLLTALTSTRRIDLQTHRAEGEVGELESGGKENEEKVGRMYVSVNEEKQEGGQERRCTD